MKNFSKNKFQKNFQKTLDNKKPKCYFKYKDVSTQLNRVLINEKSHERM